MSTEHLHTSQREILKCQRFMFSSYFSFHTIFFPCTRCFYMITKFCVNVTFCAKRILQCKIQYIKWWLPACNTRLNWTCPWVDFCVKKPVLAVKNVWIPWLPRTSPHHPAHEDLHLLLTAVLIPCSRAISGQTPCRPTCVHYAQNVCGQPGVSVARRENAFRQCDIW